MPQMDSPEHKALDFEAQAVIHERHARTFRRMAENVRAGRGLADGIGSKCDCDKLWSQADGAWGHWPSCPAFDHQQPGHVCYLCQPAQWPILFGEATK